MQSTSASLLEQLRQPSAQEAWSRFVKLYTPLLYYWAQKTGCLRQEADDLVQEVFAALIQLLPNFHYDEGKSFRGWLRTVAVNKWHEKQRGWALPTTPVGELGLAKLAVPDPVEQFWEQDYRHQLVQQALQLMRSNFPERVWLIFWDIVVEGKAATEVAAERGLSLPGVYSAKFRVLKRLQEELQGMMD